MTPPLDDKENLHQNIIIRNSPSKKSHVIPSDEIPQRKHIIVESFDDF